jgi:hypothetical protein
VVDEFVAVEELHGWSAHDINKFLQDADSFVLNLTSAKGVSLQVDVEQLANCLPLHVIACVASSGAEPRLRYWLRAVRLLHSLSTVASRYPKLEQVCNVPLLIHEQQLLKSTLRYRLQKSDTLTLNCGQLLRY